jgi:protein-disulfide isomerase
MPLFLFFLSFATQVTATDLWEKTMPHIGNPKGIYVADQYIDYKCGHCRRSCRALDKMLEDPLFAQVKINIHEFPIIGSASVLAAKAALAAYRQHHFYDMHKWFITHHQTISELSLKRLAPKIRLNPDQFIKDMDSDWANDMLSYIRQKGKTHQVKTTPTLILHAKQTITLTNTQDVDGYKDFFAKHFDLYKK